MMYEGTFDLKQLFQDFNPSKFVVFSCLLLQSVLVSIRLDCVTTASVWAIFTPLWIWKTVVLTGAAVGIFTWYKHPEQRRELETRRDVRAMLLATFLNFLILLFEILLAAKLEGSDLSWRTVFVPIFCLTVAAVCSCVFACRHKRDIELEAMVVINLLSIIFVSLRLDELIAWKWKVVFVPLWIVVAIFSLMAIYFLTVSFFIIRGRVPVQPEQRCGHIANGFLAMAICIPLLVFLGLLVERLDNNNHLSFVKIFIPLHLSLFFLLVTSLYHRGSNQWWFGLRADFCDFLLSYFSLLQEYGNIVYKTPSADDVVNGGEQNSPSPTRTKRPASEKSQVVVVEPLPLDFPD